jgi:predicted RNase H-like nuclease (RuvC/YqgF family)
MDVKWLSEFEKTVDKATAELQKLRNENEAQKKKIKTLQDQVADAKSAGKSAAGWEKERDEIIKRVEKLSTGLEKLL